MPIRLGSLIEILTHAQLADMDATVHDARYYTEAEIIALLAGYLKLDQTTEQDVDNGAPIFNGGIRILSGQKIIYDGT